MALPTISIAALFGADALADEITYAFDDLVINESLLSINNRALPKGGTWVEVQGTLSIRGGVLHRETVGGGSPAYVLAYVDIARANTKIAWRWWGVSTGIGGVIFRYSDASNFYLVTHDKVIKRTAGVDSNLFTWAAVPNGTNLLVELSGDTITVKNADTGSTLGTTSNSFNNTATKHGVGFSSASGGADLGVEGFRCYGDAVETELSSKGMEFECTSGREYSLSRPEAGNARILFKNTDGSMDPQYPSGAYYGSLDPNTRYRIKASYGGGFSPASISNLRALFVGDSIGQADSTAISTWPDDSINNLDATQATSSAKPTYKTGIVNGHSVARFDAGDSLASLVSMASPNFTFLAVLNVTSFAAHRTILGASVSGGQQWRLNTSAQQELLRQFTASVATSTSPVTAGVWVVVAIRQNAAGTWSFYLNGNLVGTGTSAQAWTAATLLIGASGSTGGESFLGDIAEIAIYDGYVSDFDLSRLVGYEGDKYAISVTGVAPTSSYSLIEGFAESYDVSWPEGDTTYSICDMELVDAFRSFEDYKLPLSIIEEVLSTDPAPIGYWTLGTDPYNTTSITTNLGTAREGETVYDGAYRGSPAKFSSDLLKGSGDYVTDFDDVDDFVLLGQVTDDALVASLDTPQDWTALTLVRGSASGFQIYAVYPRFHIGQYSAGSTAKYPLWIRMVSPTTGIIHEISADYKMMFGKEYVVAFVKSGGTLAVYVNGEKQATTFSAFNGDYLFSTQWIGSPANVYGQLGFGLTGADSVGTGTAGCLARMGHHALWDYALEAEKVRSISRAPHGVWAHERVGTRITGVLDMMGWSSSKRAIDSGGSSMSQRVGLPEGSALAYFLDMVESENGNMFMSGDGKLTFHSRYYRQTAASEATFGDSGSEIKYRPLFSYRRDIDDIFPVVSITHEDSGSTYTVQDAAQRKKVGPNTLERNLVTASQLEAVDAANYFLVQHKDAKNRIPKLVVTPQSDNTWATVLAILQDDRVTVKRRPKYYLSGYTQDYLIERVMHRLVAADNLYEIEYRLSPVDVVTYWILGSATYSVLGSTTRLGY